MGHHQISAAIAGFTLVVMGHSASAGSGEDVNALRAELDALKAANVETRQELAELKAENGYDWLTEQRATQIRGVVQDVLADSETRTSLQDSGAMAGWDKNFYLASPDGNFSLKFKGQIQVRWTMNNAKDQATEWGFENRRTKLGFEGHVIDPSWKYKIKGAFSNGSEDFHLEDAWIMKDCGDGLSVKVGAFKAPWLREELVSSSKQLTVDRSVVNEYFSQDYSKGIELRYATEDWRVSAWYGNGIGAPGIGYKDSDTSSWDNNATRWSVAGRFEYLMDGSWKQFKNFSSFRGEEFGVMFGVSGMAQKFIGSGGALGTFNSGDGVMQYGLTADVTVDFGGASLFASMVWNNNDGWVGGGAPNTDTDSTNPWGATIQGGYFITDDVEAFARYEYLNYDTNGPANDGTIYNGFTIGANWFLAGNAVKFTTDWSMNLNSFGTFAPSGIGWRADTGDNKDQWALRAQLQLLF